MTRTLILLLGTLSAIVLGLAVGAILQVLLTAQLERLDARVTVLASRLEPVSPKEVLCGVSAQMRYLSESMNKHCETVHGKTVTPLALPSVCVSNYSLAPTQGAASTGDGH